VCLNNWVDNLTERNSCVFSEVSGVVISFSNECSKQIRLHLQWWRKFLRQCVVTTQFYTEAVTRTTDLTPWGWNLVLVVEKRRRVCRICLGQNLFCSFLCRKEVMNSCMKGHSKCRAIVQINNLILMNTSKRSCRSVKKLFIWNERLLSCTSCRKNTHRTTNHHISNTF
jgi:hypothetical protein